MVVEKSCDEVGLRGGAVREMREGVCKVSITSLRRFRFLFAFRSRARSLI